MLHQLILNKKSITLTCCLALASCQDSSMQDLRTFVENTYSDQKPDIEPLPIPEPYVGFVYSAEGLTDPFALSNIAPAQAPTFGPGRDTERRKDDLEAFPLDGLKMVGTLKQGEKPWVIVNAPDGTAHRATVGNYLGQNEGRIVSISLDEQKIELSEAIIDPTGKWVDRTVFLSVDDEKTN